MLPDPHAVQDLARIETGDGTLLLRRNRGDLELITPGGFAMSSASGGASERAQVAATLAAAEAPRSVLLGGLGLGFAVTAAVAYDGLDRIEVAEIEPALPRLHREHLAELTGPALADPRVRVVVADVRAVVATHDRDLDALVLDVDNGPGWLLRADNEALYADHMLDRVAASVRDGGAVSVWAAMPTPALAERLACRFRQVVSHEVEVPRGPPDWFVVASRPRR